jgi:hypothetical protein
MDINAAPNVNSEGATRLAPAGAFSGAGRGLQQAGADISAFGMDLKRQDEKEQREAKIEAEKAKRNADRLVALDIQKKIIDGEAELTEKQLQLRQTMPPGAAGYTEAVSEMVREYNQGFAENFGDVSPENRGVMQVSLARVRARMIKGAALYQADEQAKKSVADYTDGVGKIQTMLRGGFMDLETATERATMLLDASGIPPKDAVKLQRAFISTFAATDIERELDDADTVQETAALRSRADQLREAFSPEMYSRVLRQIDTAEDRVRTTEQVKRREAINTAIKTERAGLNSDEPLSREYFDAAYDDPEKASDAFGEYQRALEEGEAARNVRGMTARETAAHRASLVEQTRDTRLSDDARLGKLGELQRFDTAVRSRQAAFKADPVNFVIANDPVVGTHLEEWRAAAREGADESVVNARRERYMNSVRSAQVLRGAAPDEIVLLPPSDVHAFEAAIANVDTSPEGATDLIKLFTNQQVVWGDDWPTVYRQLVKEDAITGGHVALARLAGDPRKNRVTVELAVALAVPTEEFKNRLPDGQKAVSDTDALVRSELAEFTKTLSGPDGGRQHQMLYQSIKQLALYRQAHGGDSMADAVSYASQKVLLEDYDVVGSYRVPKAADRNVDMVSRGASAFKQFAIAGYADRLDVAYGISAEEQLRAIAYNGRWVTNSDESGLMLVDEQGGPVTLKDGTTIARTWSQLEDYGKFDRSTRRDPGTGLRTPVEGGQGAARETVKEVEGLPGDEPGHRKGSFTDLKLAPRAYEWMTRGGWRP